MGIYNMGDKMKQITREYIGAYALFIWGLIWGLIIAKVFLIMGIL